LVEDALFAFGTVCVGPARRAAIADTYALGAVLVGCTLLTGVLDAHTVWTLLVFPALDAAELHTGIGLTLLVESALDAVPRLAHARGAFLVHRASDAGVFYALTRLDTTGPLGAVGRFATGDTLVVYADICSEAVVVFDTGHGAAEAFFADVSALARGEFVADDAAGILDASLTAVALGVEGAVYAYVFEADADEAMIGIDAFDAPAHFVADLAVSTIGRIDAFEAAGPVPAEVVARTVVVIEADRRGIGRTVSEGAGEYEVSRVEPSVAIDDDIDRGGRIDLEVQGRIDPAGDTAVVIAVFSWALDGAIRPHVEHGIEAGSTGGETDHACLGDLEDENRFWTGRAGAALSVHGALSIRHPPSDGSDLV
jgi:hypothetical protein